MPKNEARRLAGMDVEQPGQRRGPLGEGTGRSVGQPRGIDEVGSQRRLVEGGQLGRRRAALRRGDELGHGGGVPWLGQVSRLAAGRGKLGDQWLGHGHSSSGRPSANRSRAWWSMSMSPAVRRSVAAKSRQESISG